MPNNEDKKPVLPSAPEVDATLLTLMQKRRIEAEFEPDPPAAAVKPAAIPKAPSKTAANAADMAAASASLKQESDDEAAVGEKTEATKKPATKTPGEHRIRRFFGRHKKVTTALLVLAIVAGLAGVPYTRYLVAGYVLKQPYSITVTDAATERPVSSASVAIDGQTVTTDKDGKLTATGVRPGPQTITVSKKYYRAASSNVTVPLYGGKGSTRIAITATGRQVPITVTNKITNKPMANASLKSAGTEVKTDKDGKALIVLPADKPTLEVTLSAEGYNQLVTRLTVTDQEVKANTFTLVPSGRVYFLSRQSGKLDVIKTNLDGGDRQTVVYGTGKEDDRATVLLASRDWKYLALYSKRDSDVAKLYLVDTATDKLSVMDDAKATFALMGWSDHGFVYSATRTDDKPWQAGYQTVRSYNADKRQLLTMDQTQAEGDQAANKFQQFSQPYLVGDRAVYVVSWQSYSGSDLADRTDAIRSAAVGTQTKKDLRTFPSVQYGLMEARVYGPGRVYYAAYSIVDSKYDFFAYDNGQIKDAAGINQDQFFAASYPTYLVSPSGSQTFWSDQRDGRETFFVGDAAAQNAKQVGVIEDGAVFGWYGNEYVLTSKKGSELLIMSVAGGTPLKVADYHKPQVSYRGYGGGYGGL